MQHEWIMGLIGGALIGLGGAVYLVGTGRIMGASGIIGGLVDGSGRATARDRFAFLLAVFAVPLAISVISGSAPETHLTTNWLVIIAAGLLVGVGTRVANGCTSGHGVCGISRMSVRGIVATVFYIGAGGLSIVFFRHLLGVI
ncbi:MAG: YeeE/YedE family protein [Marinibacterium sp.]